MNVETTEIEGLYIIKPRVFEDARGYFFESFSQREFEEKIGKVNFVQDNESCSSRGVLRGLHFQKPPYSQAKLVRCVVGKVRDVAVDLRDGSPTYGKYVAVELSGDNHQQFFIPKGFAHGFEVLSDVAIFQYKCDEYYHPESEGGLDPFDSTLGIHWATPREEMVISEKDTRHPVLSDFKTPFK
ncbi:MAG: dTDP-4-dehydrorhamnose 3,5-epimerase [Muribaculaceae bacterium]|nr:dTDP-4-dehydrorhamnose 3,5-epimerase [Muribaculaceae bacterium]